MVWALGFCLWLVRTTELVRQFPASDGSRGRTSDQARRVTGVCSSIDGDAREAARALPCGSRSHPAEASARGWRASSETPSRRLTQHGRACVRGRGRARFCRACKPWFRPCVEPRLLQTLPALAVRKPTSARELRANTAWRVATLTVRTAARAPSFRLLMRGPRAKKSHSFRGLAATGETGFRGWTNARTQTFLSGVRNTHGEVRLGAGSARELMSTMRRILQRGVSCDQRSSKRFRAGKARSASV
jgi:hypothetical protein